MIKYEKDLKIYQEVLLKLNDIILEDNLSEGDRLPSERELAYRLNVGRSSIREALKILELLGLISIRRGDGTFIDDHTSNRLVEIVAFYILRNNKSKSDLLEFQKLIELDIIRLAATRINDENLNHIERIHQLMQKKVQLKETISEEDYLFHKTLAGACDNKLLYKSWLKLIEYGSIIIDTLGNNADEEEIVQEHERILDALKDRDIKKAEYQMRLHLERYEIRA